MFFPDERDGGDFPAREDRESGGDEAPRDTVGAHPQVSMGGSAAAKGTTKAVDGVVVGKPAVQAPMGRLNVPSENGLRDFVVVNDVPVEVQNQQGDTEKVGELAGQDHLERLLTPHVDASAGRDGDGHKRVGDQQ